MYKQSPSRNHRSKGIKVKHILQICVLLAVCFWLLYQFKHSHDKQKEFESKDEKAVGKMQSESVNQRFGRKDIPRVTETAKDGEKREEDEDDKDGEEEENKHEDDESEIDDSRIAEREDERGGGDDEIDEHEPEKTEEEEVEEEKGSATEHNHTEDEENEDAHEEGLHRSVKENEDTHEEGHPENVDTENSGKEGHTEHEENDDIDKDPSEREVASDDQDHDIERNTREAQEELYKADDASSEVAQNVQMINQEIGNSTMGHANGIYGQINFGRDHEFKTSDNGNELINDVQPREDVHNVASNTAITEQRTSEVNLTKPDDSSLPNSALPVIGSNTTVIGELSTALLSNGTQTVDSYLSQNGTVEHKATVKNHQQAEEDSNKATDDKNQQQAQEDANKATDDKNQQQAQKDANKATDDKNQQQAEVDANKAENVNTNTTLASSDATNGTDAGAAAKDESVGDMIQGEKSEDSGKGDSNGNSESHSIEGTEALQHDPIDASDTTMLTQVERESRTDLDTLPDIRSEVRDSEATVAE